MVMNLGITCNSILGRTERLTHVAVAVAWFGSQDALCTAGCWLTDEGLWIAGFTHWWLQEHADHCERFLLVDRVWLMVIVWEYDQAIIQCWLSLMSVGYCLSVNLISHYQLHLSRRPAASNQPLTNVNQRTLTAHTAQDRPAIESRLHRPVCPVVQSPWKSCKGNQSKRLLRYVKVKSNGINS